METSWQISPVSWSYSSYTGGTSWGPLCPSQKGVKLWCTFQPWLEDKRRPLRMGKELGEASLDLNLAHGFPSSSSLSVEETGACSPTGLLG